MKTTIKALIFDCFGVIITDALETIVAELRERQPDIANNIVAIITAASRGQITRQQSTEEVAALLNMSVEQYIDIIRSNEVKNQNLLDHIVRWRKNYKVGLLSNISIGGLSARFELPELEKYFDTVVASGEIGFAKPEPQAYKITAERLNVLPEECLYIDDREEYCVGAQNTGMQALIYHSNSNLLRDLEVTYGIQVFQPPANDSTPTK